MQAKIDKTNGRKGQKHGKYIWGKPEIQQNWWSRVSKKENNTRAIFLSLKKDAEEKLMRTNV